ncbi:MAG: undecaprenyl-diphosphatase UppP [Minisyncoccia bacterium]
MTAFTAIILGIVEGATEFIPVSSTGHLILVRNFLSIDDTSGLSFDAILQFSATLSLIAYFWKELLNLTLTFWDIVTRRNVDQKSKTLLYSILLGTIPAVIFGLILERQMETIFRNVQLVTVTLILGSLLMWFSEKFSQKYTGANKALNLGRGVVIGFFQSLALLPGISRSGATISGGLIIGLRKDEAVRFSFLLSMPILLGSGLKKIFDVREVLFSSDFGPPLLLGSISAFLVGLFSISFLIKYLKTHNMNVFIWYRVVLALIIFLVSI